MGKYIADKLRRLAESCDSENNTECLDILAEEIVINQKFSKVQKDINDMKSVMGYIDMRLTSLERQDNEGKCKIVSINK